MILPFPIILMDVNWKYGILVITVICLKLISIENKRGEGGGGFLKNMHNLNGLVTLLTYLWEIKFQFNHYWLKERERENVWVSLCLSDWWEMRIFLSLRSNLQPQMAIIVMLAIKRYWKGLALLRPKIQDPEVTFSSGDWSGWFDQKLYRL